MELRERPSELRCAWCHGPAAGATACDRIVGGMSERAFPDWPTFYRDRPVETMPWFFAPLDPDLEQELASRAIASGRVLDLGAGAGSQAVELARRGFRVTATDIAPAAVEATRERARAAGVEVEAVQDDVLDSRLGGTFDVVVDRGCFHTLPPSRRPDYARTVAARLAPGGWLLLECFSDLQPGDVGPYQLGAADVAACFAPTFELVSARRTFYQGQLPQHPHALSCALRRR